jgi:CheY-like chemotaxis protein
MRLAFRKVAPNTILRTLDNGEDALAYLAGTGKFANRQDFPFPVVMLLDIKMPRMNGFEVLAGVSKLKLRQPPFIIVLSSSKLQVDIDKADALGASFFHTKPGDFDSLCELIKRISDFFIGASGLHFKRST